MEKEEERKGEAREVDGRGEETPAVASAPVVVPAGNGGHAVAAGDEGKLYPSPLLRQEELLGNPVLFGESLRRFHSIMGTKFMIPVIGGKELDLHLLYAEVTQRGGLEKVTADRRWREVIAVFRFPPTTTSASFVLRKYYVNLLHHFEQVHLHGRRGPLVPPPAATSFTVSGTIDGKFEHGYLVTVNLGSEILRGVLYHALPSGTPPTSPASGFSAADGFAAGRAHRRRRKGWRSRDPAHPKPNRSAYNFFFADKHSKLKTLYPHREREFSKMIGASWSKLTDEERMVYQDCGLKDKERYKREMQEYRERLKLSAEHCVTPQS
ncbi:unnamed protein product [Spirodela intermedia]|uniref:Uncharacterized protein n=2 Tax=Spirodela intermedia TaxID=51605 RepID=A0A7I8K365_SPIIN|nr:unnamed protein product [Spirodela intermedia]CAA6656044.1 unnamed protein product [Spirodela intermedia]CAA7391476.1 unnamed protein product [Spirodela intermedia]